MVQDESYVIYFQSGQTPFIADKKVTPDHTYVQTHTHTHTHTNTRIDQHTGCEESYTTPVTRTPGRPSPRLKHTAPSA